MPANPLEHPAIELRELSHTYREGNRTNPVLTSLSSSMDACRVQALLGQSGSGKSTLLNLIAGLEPIQSGDIRLFGQPLAGLGDKRRTLLRRHKVGFIYQSFNLIPTLTVFENTALPLALNGISKVEQISRVNTLLELIGLGDRQLDFPDRLSGGEQQRVAIARAIVHKPELILADEPTGNLDAASGRQVLDTLLDLVRNDQRTLLLVTHSREVARRADAVWTLQDGHLLQQNSDSAW